MEIPASLFLGIWANIGVISLYLGFEALKKTDLPASVPWTVLFLFKHFLAIAACHSSTHALVFRAKLRIHVLNYYALFVLAVLPVAFLSDAFAWSVKIYSVLNAYVLICCFLPWKKSVLGDEFFHKASVGIALFPLLFVLPPSQKDGSSLVFSGFISVSNVFVTFQPRYTAFEADQIGLQFHLMAIFTLLVTTELNPVLVLLAPLVTCMAQAAISVDERFRRWLTFEENVIFSELKRVVRKNGDVIEFSVGMAATILFQFFFRMTTFDHVVAFIYFAVAWVANLALLLCRRDFGVFNFLLSNVIVGCTVSQFGFGRTTWLAYAAALLLHTLRVKLGLICVVDRDGREAVVTWRQNETEETNGIAI